MLCCSSSWLCYLSSEIPLARCSYLSLIMMSSNTCLHIYSPQKIAQLSLTFVRDWTLLYHCLLSVRNTERPGKPGNVLTSSPARSWFCLSHRLQSCTARRQLSRMRKRKLYHAYHKALTVTGDLIIISN